MATVSHYENVATVKIPSANGKVKLSIKSNAPVTQYITISQDGKKVSEYSGRGEGMNLLAETTINASSKPYEFKFEHDEGGKRVACQQVAEGGPYVVGKLNMLMLVVENGGDADFNDVIAWFEWHA